MKKIVKCTAIMTAVIMLLSCVSVSAEWKFAGYDTRNPEEYLKVYNEVIDGNYTTNHRFDIVDDKDVKWVHTGYETAYPHVGYDTLVLEGFVQDKVTRHNGLYPQWETRFRDFMWEVKAPHRIYERQQTKINNSYWDWDFGNEELNIPDSKVFVPTNRFAEVTYEYNPYGIASFDLEGNLVEDDVMEMYLSSQIVFNKDIVEDRYVTVNGKNAYAYGNICVTLDEENLPTKNVFPNTFFSAENLSQKDAYDQFVVTDEEIAKEIGLVSAKYVTGPTYYGENPTKVPADMYIDLLNKDLDPEEWTWDEDIIVHDWADISWTKPMYEMEEPYNYYQYLVVNGLVFDGRNDTPVIFRYTGGKADPDVEWRYAFAQKEKAYEIIEEKWIRNNTGEMIQAFDADGNAIYRLPTGKYANGYYVITDTEVQYWIKDDNSSYKLFSEDRTAINNDFYMGYTNGATLIK